MERIGLEDGARQPARRVADAVETDDDDLAAEPMHLRQSRCISGRAAVSDRQVHGLLRPRATTDRSAS